MLTFKLSSFQHHVILFTILVNFIGQSKNFDLDNKTLYIVAIIHSHYCHAPEVESYMCSHTCPVGGRLTEA